MSDTELIIKNKFFNTFHLLENNDLNDAIFNELYNKYKKENRTDPFIPYITDYINNLPECMLVKKPTEKLECKLFFTLRDNYIHVPQPPDGNCLYHSLNYILRTGYTHSMLRKNIIQYMIDNKKGLLMNDWINLKLEHSYKKTFDEYIKYMANEGNYGGDIEIYIASRIYQCKINAFDNTGILIEEIDHFTKFIYKRSDKIVYLYHCILTNGLANHFDALTLKRVPEEKKTESLYDQLDQGTLIKENLIRENFIKNIKLNKTIDKEMPLNIVFYASGNARTEIFLIEQLLIAGYTVKNIILIDRIYDKPICKLTNMIQKIKMLYDINVILCKDYDNYHFLIRENMFIHYIVSINYEHINDLSIDDYLKSISDDKKLIDLYQRNSRSFPSHIILYNSSGNEFNEDKIKFHIDRIADVEKKQQILIKEQHEEFERIRKLNEEKKERIEFEKLKCENDPLIQEELLKLLHKGGYKHILSQKEYIFNKQKYIMLKKL